MRALQAGDARCVYVLLLPLVMLWRRRRRSLDDRHAAPPVTGEE